MADDPTESAVTADDDTSPEPTSAKEDAPEQGQAKAEVPAEVKAALRKANKEAETLRLKLKDYEDRDKTEAERLAAERDAAKQQTAAANARAVRAEVKALAADTFADPDDAAAAIDPATYLTDDGEVDTDRIKARLGELLEAKPHWRKPAAASAKPKPDPSQGARGDTTPSDFRTADKAAFEAELAKYGLRPRS